MTMPDSKRQAASLLDGFATDATDSAAFNRAYLDAAQRSGRLWAVGLQDLGERCFGAAQGINERFQVTGKALSSARSVREALVIQAAHLSTEVEQSVKQAADLQEAALQLVQQASAPVIEQMTVSSAAVTARNFQS